MTEAEFFQKINKKNKTSAVFFLVGALAVVVITVLFIAVFMFLFGALQAVIFGVLGSRAAGEDTWSIFLEMVRTFWIFAVFSIIAIVPQIIAGVALLKKLSWARTAGIVAFIITLITFTPVALILIYPFVFLVGNDGKYLYQTLIKNNYLEKT